MTGPDLEEKLKSVSLSRKDFALLIDVSYRTVNRWINGEAPVPKVVALLVKELTSKK